MDWSATDYAASRRSAPARRATSSPRCRRPVSRLRSTSAAAPETRPSFSARFPAARLLGIDSSPDMIAAARRRLPDVRFEVADLARWQAPEPPDLVFANAVLQWLPDHAALLPRLLAQLAPGGTLAVQVPDNLDEPAHVLMRATAGEGPWAGKLAGAAAARSARHGPAWYWRLLRSAAAQVEVWSTTYFHPLPGGAPGMIDWFRATGLRPFLAPLDAGEREAFLAAYEAALTRAYPAEANGTVLLPFPRLFLVAVR